MREKDEEALTELKNCPNWILRLVMGLKTDRKQADGGRYMKGSDGKLCFNDKKEVKSGRIIWKVS